MILLPPKIFLDSCHLINMAKVRAGRTDIKFASEYAHLFEMILSRHFGAVFHYFAPLEWIDGNATKESSFEIAAILDSARLCYEFFGDTFAYQHEALQEVRRIAPALELPQYDVLGLHGDFSQVRHPAVELFRLNPGLVEANQDVLGDIELPENWRCQSVRKNVEVAWQFKTSNPVSYRGRVDGHRESYLRDVEALKLENQKQFSTDQIRDWLKRFFKIEKIISLLEPSLKVNEIIAEIQTKNCPAISLYLKSHEKRVASGNNPKDSDVGDWSSVPIVVHSDVFVTEKNLRHFLLQADPTLESKVAKDPSQALDMLERFI